MKINEVEALAGISKKNIRFYEEQGLLSPRRAENGYRDYGEGDVRILQRIKLLRKLGVPLEEIRKMQSGGLTVADGMRRHMVSLEREKQNIEQSMLLCRELEGQQTTLSNLDAESYLSRMEQLEQGGTSFHNKLSQDIRVRYVAPVAVTAAVVALMAALSALIVWACHTNPQDAPPLWFVVILVGVFSTMGLGAVLALVQRIQEIQKGEIDDAKSY